METNETNLDEMVEDTEKEVSEETIEETIADQEEKVEEEVKEEVDPRDEQIKVLSEKFNELNDTYLRLYADFDNFRKRTSKEKSDIAVTSQIELINKILPVLDNFERALLVECSDEAYKTGIEMVAKQLSSALDSMGVKPIGEANEKFDPNLHYAVMTGEDPDKENDVILEVFQKGYIYKEKIVRPSMVKVNKK